MEFLGIGPLELIFVLLIALIVLGPKDMAKAGHALGVFLRRTILSPTFLDIRRRLRTLPTEMMREAGLDDADLSLGLNDPNLLGTDVTPTGSTPNRPARPVDDFSDWTNPPAPDDASIFPPQPPADAAPQ